MGTSSRTHATTCRPRLAIYTIFFLLILLYVSFLLLIKLDDIATRISSQTKTIVGHNLEPPPWHLFPPKEFNDGNRYSKALKFIKCSHIACGLTRSVHTTPKQLQQLQQDLDRSRNKTATCPPFFRWIHQDLEPWTQSRISQSKLMEAQQFASFRIVIVGGRLYVDFYFACVQSRAMFTIWGLLQLLKRYPGMVPDVDLMFDCMDKPSVSRKKYEPKSKRPPPPMFRYCTTEGHFDIPFPDWSFWGWPETNIAPWDEEFRNIKEGSQAVNWKKKQAHAYWKGNPDVASPLRIKLLKCNDSQKWGAEIMRQNWVEEGRGGFKKSKLADQCKHRYKIYAEGYAWSVSLKYILSCGSVTLIISPQYEDFFSRGLMPKENYWPISIARLCRSIKSAVDWGNANPSKAEVIGKGGQDLMENLAMERVYDYMYHLITEYSKLQDFKPAPPPSAQEMCLESLLCFADPKQRKLLEKSTVSASLSLPCTLPHANRSLIKRLVQKKRKIISDVLEMESKPTNKMSTAP